MGEVGASTTQAFAPKATAEGNALTDIERDQLEAKLLNLNTSQASISNDLKRIFSDKNASDGDRILVQEWMARRQQITQMLTSIIQASGQAAMGIIRNYRQ